jgi:hypothetical protein
VRSREKILANLDQLYRESYDRAKAANETVRMVELDSAYTRDQLMLEILLDIRDLFAVAPAAPPSGSSALEKLESLRRLARR